MLRACWTRDLETEVLLQRLPHGDGLPVPSPASAGAAGCDVTSADEVVLGPLERRLIRTGFAVAVPPGFEIQVRPRGTGGFGSTGA
jgi:dUTP pyrophosphatase